MAACLVVLTDFSPASDRALRYAVRLAPTLAARVVLVHVVPAAPPPHAAVELARRAAQATASGAECAAELVSAASLPLAVCAAVQRHEALLVVAGKCATRKVLRTPADSAGLSLLRLLPCPLLMVPLRGREQRGAPARVLVAADAEPLQLGWAAAAANHVLAACAPAVTVVHVTRPERNSVADEPHLKNLLSYLAPVTYQTIKSGQANRLAVAHDLLKTQEQLHAQWLLVVARQRSVHSHRFHRSVTVELTQSSSVPVLVVPVA